MAPGRDVPPSRTLVIGMGRRPGQALSSGRAHARLLLVAVLAGVTGISAGGRLFAQDPPTRRDVALVARDFRFSPDRIEVSRDELVRITVRSEDIAYSFTVDEYRVSRRVPAGGTATIELRADREGTFPFYSNLTSEPGHAQMRGTLVVRPR